MTAEVFLTSGFPEPDEKQALKVSDGQKIPEASAEQISTGDIKPKIG